MKKMNEDSKPEMEKLSPQMEELMAEILNKLKSLTNTMVRFGTELQAFGEQLRKPPDQGPIVKEFSKRMEELENNTKEEAMRLEEVSTAVEGTGKYLWDTAKMVGKIQTSFNEFANASRAAFDGFVVKSVSSTSVMEALRKDLKDHTQFFREPRKEVHYSHFMVKSAWLIILLVIAICALSVALLRVTSEH